MNDYHPHSGVTYRIVRRMNRTYGVEVKIPGALSTLVTSFASKDAALDWIEKRQRQAPEGHSIRQAALGLRKR